MEVLFLNQETNVWKDNLKDVKIAVQNSILMKTKEKEFTLPRSRDFSQKAHVY
jgi:hypothetical protein